MPKEISEVEFLENGLEKIVNKQTFINHLKSRSDAHTRLKYLNLIEPTLQERDIKLKVLSKDGEERDAYLKAFEYGDGQNRKLFYTLITEQNDSYLITAYPINRIKEVERIIDKAISIEYGRPTEALRTATWNNASSIDLDYTIKQNNTMDVIKDDTIIAGQKSDKEAINDRMFSKNESIEIGKEKMTKLKEQAGQNMKLERFLSDGKLDENIMRQYAEPMPKIKFNNIEQFKSHFENSNGKFGYIKTPYKEVKVNMAYAYRHFYKNTYDTNRNSIKQAFFATFKDPLFVAKNNTKGRESVYFYKPFYDRENEILNLFGIGVDKEGKIDFKTFYNDNTGSRFKEMLKLNDEDIIFIKENPPMLP